MFYIGNDSEYDAPSSDWPKSKHNSAYSEQKDQAFHNQLINLQTFGLTVISFTFLSYFLFSLQLQC